MISAGAFVVVVGAWVPDVELELQYTNVGDWARLGGEASSTRMLLVHQVVLRLGLKSTLQWGWCGISRENGPGGVEKDRAGGFLSSSLSESSKLGSAGIFLSSFESSVIRRSSMLSLSSLRRSSVSLSSTSALSSWR